MENMAGRKRKSAEDIMRKLRRADELTAAGETQEEIPAELGVSVAASYNWHHQYGGMDTDVAKEPGSFISRTARMMQTNHAFTGLPTTISPTASSCIHLNPAALAKVSESPDPSAQTAIPS
jgi:putative transposase